MKKVRKIWIGLFYAKLTKILKANHMPPILREKERLERSVCKMANYMYWQTDSLLHIFRHAQLCSDCSWPTFLDDLYLSPCTAMQWLLLTYICRWPISSTMHSYAMIAADLHLLMTYICRWPTSTWDGGGVREVR